MNSRPEASKGPTLPLAAAAVAAKLKAATRAGAGFFDPAVRKLRSELAEALKAVLLEDYAAAQVGNGRLFSTMRRCVTLMSTAECSKHARAPNDIITTALTLYCTWCTHAGAQRGADAVEGGVLSPHRGVPPPHSPRLGGRRPRPRAPAQGANHNH